MFLYGYGMYAKALLLSLKECGISPEAIVDKYTNLKRSFNKILIKVVLGFLLMGKSFLQIIKMVVSIIKILILSNFK